MALMIVLPPVFTVLLQPAVLQTVDFLKELFSVVVF